MTKQQAAKLLSLIKLSYPTAYKDIDKDTANATVNMWAMSFPDVPYPIMEQAFNHYRMTNKFPPTVAEMVGELKVIYYEALEGASIHNSFGNRELVSCYREIMSYTSRYAKGEVGAMNLDNLLPQLNGGGYNERLTAPGDRLGVDDRLSLLDAGD